MRLRYTTRAVAELDKVLTFIDREYPQGALRVKARMQAVIDRLVRYPESGRLTSKAGLRRVVVWPYPYLILQGIGNRGHDPRRPSQRTPTSFVAVLTPQRSDARAFM